MASDVPGIESTHCIQIDFLPEKVIHSFLLSQYSINYKIASLKFLDWAWELILGRDRESVAI